MITNKNSYHIFASKINSVVFLWPEKYGAQRWIDFGKFKIQPSEFAKIVTLILGATETPSSVSTPTIVESKVSTDFPPDHL